MPVPSFLASIADKAQSAIHPSNASGDRHHAVSAIQHQLRAFGQQYTSTPPVQKIITVEKSVAINFDAVARDAKSQSKELYTWGQNEAEDLKDVTDRLAYLNFVQGSLATSLAQKLDAARAPFKALRDAETGIAPRRNIRAGLQLELSRLEHSQQKGMERKMVELKDQIRKAELDDEPQEKEIELLKRKAIRESEQLKWEAFREYGEKLALLSQAATPIIGALPTLPPTEAHPYTSAQATGAARASLQRALDNYKTGHFNLPSEPVGADLRRSDTRSFGESHASELSNISPVPSAIPHAGVPLAPASQPMPLKPSEATTTTPSAPINVAHLNQSPVEVPASTIPPVAHATPTLTSESPTLPKPAPAITPTIAETGIPVSGGSEGLGPASGSLHDLRKDTSAAPANNPTPPIAVAQGTTQSQPKYESAEDEKKRLEREERERLFGSGPSGQGSSKKEQDEDLPPQYQEF